MNSSWLKKRGEIILKYATSLSQKLDKVKITFDYPDCGWMPMHFHKNYEDKSVDRDFAKFFQGL